MKTWPGVEVSAGSAQGKALLGSSNGAGVDFLVAQHKRQLGHKILDSIRIFGETRQLINRVRLLFVIKDV